MQPIPRPTASRVPHQTGQEWLWGAAETASCSGGQSREKTEETGQQCWKEGRCPLKWTGSLFVTTQRTNLLSQVLKSREKWEHLVCVLVCQERELVLKRIAEDRRSLQEKKQSSAATETSPPSGQGQKLGGKIQTNVDNNCILMVRQRGV